MKIVDLSHLMNVHTPGRVGYAGNQMYYAQNLQTKMIVAQRIDTALHVGTHIDGAMHGTDGMGDMASYPLDFLVGPGAVVDVSAHIDDWPMSVLLRCRCRRSLPHSSAAAPAPPTKKNSPHRNRRRRSPTLGPDSPRRARLRLARARKRRTQVNDPPKDHAKTSIKLRRSPRSSEPRNQQTGNLQGISGGGLSGE